LLAETDIHPLIQAHTASDTIAWHDGKAITTETFLHDVYAVASQLPAGQYAINLCEDRYWFLVGFAALLVRNQTNLLPPNRAIQVIEEIAHDYPGTYCLYDNNLPDIKIPAHRINSIKPETLNDSNSIPLIPGQHLAAIVFTSGSTGKAQPNLKYWKDLITGAKMKQKRFGFGEGGKKHLS
jgi:acyl-coenzyme A synthetase/AMP-(fatty) acid ligase